MFKLIVVRKLSDRHLVKHIPRLVLNWTRLGWRLSRVWAVLERVGQFWDGVGQRIPNEGVVGLFLGGRC